MRRRGCRRRRGLVECEAPEALRGVLGENETGKEEALLVKEGELVIRVRPCCDALRSGDGVRKRNGKNCVFIGIAMTGRAGSLSTPSWGLGVAWSDTRIAIEVEEGETLCVQAVSLDIYWRPRWDRRVTGKDVDSGRQTWDLLIIKLGAASVRVGVRAAQVLSSGSLILDLLSLRVAHACDKG